MVFLLGKKQSLLAVRWPKERYFRAPVCVCWGGRWGVLGLENGVGGETLETFSAAWALGECLWIHRGGSWMPATGAWPWGELLGV